MDHIIRAMSKDGFVKAVAVVSTDLVERARNIHHAMSASAKSSAAWALRLDWTRSDWRKHQ